MQEPEHLVKNFAHLSQPLTRSVRRGSLISLLNVSAQPKYVFDNLFSYFDQQLRDPRLFSNSVAV